jgi:uncharacterized circularly permuted ATP-grasp superfamily protein/uncharacterized alpha-E superfamily protein
MVYRPLFHRLDALPRGQIRALDERLEATMREMGVTFDIARERPWGRRPWFCDVLPQIFSPEEWEPLEKGIRQRLRAFELFLCDIYGKKEILRANLFPIQPVLGSTAYQRAAASLTLPGGAYLHLSGLSLCRVPSGEFVVKQHYFSNASGISYMIQNRRALARVIPQSFQDFSIRSIADAPVDILELLRSLSDHPDPTVVLLSSGPGSAVYSEHSFLARRMGIPLVQGGDLLVLNDAVFLKTVSGLEKVEVIYNRISDQWLDPMVFRRDSLLGVAGLVHCIRKGTVAVVNSIGSQLSDDRALLPLAGQIIRFYLGERPLLRSLPTYWLGDIDQREMVLSDIEKFTIRPLFGEKIVLGGNGQVPSGGEIENARQIVLRNASQYVAQPQDCDALTISYHGGRKVIRRQDHILFALRNSEGQYDVFPGALTRVSTENSSFTANELGGGSKDTWVQAPQDFVEEPPPDRARLREALLPSQHVSSRVAEAFYWTGRYLERAHNLAVMIGVIESLELEELNPTERTLYRPVWNRILPPLENPGSVSRRNISSPAGRYRLTLDLEEPDSVVRAILRAAANSESILECLSLEAWGVLTMLRSRFQRARFRPQASQDDLTSFTRRYCDYVVKAVPEFFGTAQGTMIADGGWAFCEIGQLLERAIITGNAVCSIIRPMPRRNAPFEHESEIRLSAFLRLINSRDVYRRVYQLRIEAAPMLDLLWKNPVAPRSVARCLEICRERLRGTREQASPATMRTLAGIEQLLHEIRLTDWDKLVDEANSASSAKSNALLDHGFSLLNATLEIHHLIADGFLNHQIHMGPDAQPMLFGLKNAL